MSDFRRAPLHEMTLGLAATARGDLPATHYVHGGTLVSVTSGEVLPNVSVVAVQGSRVAYVGPEASHTIEDETRVIVPELHVSDKVEVGEGGFVDLIEQG